MKKLIVLLMLICSAALLVPTAMADFDPATTALLQAFPGDGTFTEHDVEFTKDSDGITLRGTMLIPDDVEGPLPFVILSHGFNSSRNSCAKLAYAFGKNGIASVRFDFGGSGASGGKSNKMSVLTEVDDLKAIIAYVRSLEIADVDHIFLLGNSMGGLVTALTTLEVQDQICAVMMNYPALPLADSVRAGHLMAVNFDPNNIPKVLRPDGFAIGRMFVTDIIDLDFYADLDKITVDVLLMHGDQDDMVPISSSDRAAELIPNCTYIVMPGGGHGFEGEQLVQQAELNVNFVKDHLM